MANKQTRLYDNVSDASAGQPVECLGKVFLTDQARREHFLARLRTQLEDSTYRNQDGFPIGEVDDILEMSDPPFFTACPNPFLTEFIEHNGKPYATDDSYLREPLAVDSSEGKTDPIYTAHSYHTKVPYKAIIPAILHYTSPGDVILDGFAGSGMTGVAAQMCGQPSPDLRSSVEAACKLNGRRLPEWGVRKAVLSDLGPAAAFIARGYNLPVDVRSFVKAAGTLLSDLKSKTEWMYQTIHTDGKTKGTINYTIWSECLACNNCGKSLVFFNEALDPESKRVQDAFPCPHCGTEVTKDSLERIMETLVDKATGKHWRRIQLVPVVINYSVKGTKYEKVPDDADIATLAQVSALASPDSVPTTPFPIKSMYHGSRLEPKGFTQVSHLYLPRAGYSLGLLWDAIKQESHPAIRHLLYFFIEQGIRGMSLLNRYKPIQYGKIGGSQVGLDLTGVYYVPSISTEVSPWYQFEGKLSRLEKAFELLNVKSGNTIISTSTAARTGLPDCSIDYIFTDPPFGENIFYADLNFMVEAWYRIVTNTNAEAIVDKAKGKALYEYQELMKACFEEYHRVLKPGRWITVVFHNSKNAVWNAIQEAMLAAGFVVADVRTLDKQQGSYRQVTSSAVKQDLVISAYRPTQELEARMKLSKGSEESAWEFVQSHLRQVPGFIIRESRVQIIAERQAYLLYDRMVAFHVQRGFSVPLSSAEFHAGLHQRFPERDGMYLLPDQVTEYDRKRLEAEEVEQYELFVSDEKSAIQWVRRQLSEQPMKYQELQPVYMKEAQRVWEKHEQPLELRTILDQNFLEDQKGTWRVPDPKNEVDLEQVRSRALMKEFQEYVDTKGKMKVVRTEALRAGFKECWQKQVYTTIVQVAKKVPESVIQEDSALLMYLDNALMRTAE